MSLDCHVKRYIFFIDIRETEKNICIKHLRKFRIELTHDDISTEPSNGSFHSGYTPSCQIMSC